MISLFVLFHQRSVSRW